MNLWGNIKKKPNMLLLIELTVKEGKDTEMFKVWTACEGLRAIMKQSVSQGFRMALSLFMYTS